VVELFTSQGCSSCPPADKIIGELAEDSSVIALSMPIDYWDYLGWKDTLADARFSARQKAYSLMRGDRDVYTPQVVVNGSAHVVGSDRAGIERAIGITRRTEGVMSLPVSMKLDGDQITVGQPLVSKAAITAVVLEHRRGPKVIIGKFRKRKDYRLKKGHRQDFTRVRVTDIKL